MGHETIISFQVQLTGEDKAGNQVCTQGVQDDDDDDDGDEGGGDGDSGGDGEGWQAQYSAVFIHYLTSSHHSVRLVLLGSP